MYVGGVYGFSVISTVGFGSGFGFGGVTGAGGSKSFILVRYQEVHNLNMFYIGFSLANTSLFYIVFFVICAFAIDTIKKDIQK